MSVVVLDWGRIVWVGRAHLVGQVGGDTVEAKNVGDDGERDDSGSARVFYNV